MLIGYLLEVCSCLDQLAELLEAPAGFIEGGRAPFGIRIENIHLEEFADGVFVLLLCEEAFTDLELRPRSRRTLMAGDNLPVCADRFVVALLMLASPPDTELRLVPVRCIVEPFEVLGEDAFAPSPALKNCERFAETE